MKAVLALLLVVVAVAGGGALGMALRVQASAPPGEAPEAQAGTASIPPVGDPSASAAGASKYVGFSRKFVVPVVQGERTQALLILDLAIDAPSATANRLLEMKPRLRDALLRVLFELAATDAFSQTYIEAPIMEELRQKLRSAAREFAGPSVREVLILDLVRKEF